MRRSILLGALLLAPAGFALPEPPASPGPWTGLFGGKDASAWRTYGKDDFPAFGWTIEPPWDNGPWLQSGSAAYRVMRGATRVVSPVRRRFCAAGVASCRGVSIAFPPSQRRMRG